MSAAQNSSRQPGERIAPAQTASARSVSPWLAAGLVFLLTVVAYLPALQCGFIWDDDDYVTENLTLRDLNGLKRIWFELGAVPQYYPLVHTTFWLEYRLWGLNPVGYHAVNILLHGLAAVLLGLVLRRLELRAAWFAAALFAVHPVMVESVAWITERKNVLSAVFYFAAALAYLTWRERRRPGHERPAAPASAWRFYWLALGLFACAMLSKTVTCSLPAALLLVAWWREGRLRWREVVPLIPFFAVGVSLGLLTAWLEKHQVGALGSDWALTFAQRVLIAGRALWFYASKLLWPSNLTFIYPRWEIHPALWWQWLFPTAALGVGIALWAWRRRIGRGPLTAVLFFGGTLFPALGFFNVYPMRFSFVADHFQYLASVGLLALAAEAARRGTDALLRGRVRSPWGRVALTAPVLVLLAGLTWRQCGVYRDLETLWRDTLRKNPACWMAHNNLGHLLAARGDTDQAEAHYRKALELKPDYEEALNNLGHVFFVRDRLDEAIEYFRRALAREPNHPLALCNLGAALVLQGHEEEGLEHLRRALALSPNSPETLNNLGAALAGRNQFAEAIACYEKSLQIRPGQAQTHLNYGVALREIGRLDDALAHLREAVRLAPNHARARSELVRALAAARRLDEAIQESREAARLSPADAAAHYNLGVLLSAAGRTDEAIEQYRAALKYQPGHAEAHNNLGVALTLKGERDAALMHLHEALRLRPDYAEAHNNLAFVLLEAGRIEEAVGHLETALRLHPDYPQAHYQLGRAWERLGQPERAIRHWKEALRLAPDFAPARQELRRLGVSP